MSIVFFARFDGLHERRQPVVRLNDEFHQAAYLPFFFFSVHSTAA